MPSKSISNVLCIYFPGFFQCAPTALAVDVEILLNTGLGRVYKEAVLILVINQLNAQNLVL